MTDGQEANSIFFKSGYRESESIVDEAFSATSCGLSEFPQCPSCGNILQRTLTIPAFVMVDICGGAPYGDQDLLFCWRCYASSMLAYRGSVNSGIAFLDWLNKPISNDYPLWEDYPVAFPERRLSFTPEADREREILSQAYFSRDYFGLDRSDLGIVERSSVFRPRYSIGGIPFLMNELMLKVCPCCKGKLNLLATIPNDNGTPMGFCDNEFVIMIYMYCLDCFCIVATHHVD